MDRQSHGAAQPDAARRRLTGAGLAGAGVLMTISSRSALGATVGMCGSESASAALSRTGEVASCGCSPGFWWSPNGLNVWNTYLATLYPSSASFNSVFCPGFTAETKFFKSDTITLANVKKNGKVYFPTNYDRCGDTQAVAMHAVAATLNAQFYGERFPPFHTGSEVIQAFQSALQADALGKGCDNLNLFKAQVDIYDDSLFCFNGKPTDA